MYSVAIFAIIKKYPLNLFFILLPEELEPASALLKLLELHLQHPNYKIPFKTTMHFLIPLGLHLDLQKLKDLGYWPLLACQMTETVWLQTSGTYW